MRLIIFLFIICSNVNIALCQNNKGNATVKFGVYKIDGNGLSSAFDYGSAISIGVESSERHMLYLSTRLSNVRTQNKFNDFKFNISYLEGAIGVSYPFFESNIIPALYAYGGIIVKKSIESNDLVMSGEINSYFNNFNIGIGSQLKIKLPVEMRNSKVYVLVSYERGIVNLIKRFGIYVSSMGGKLNGKSLQFGLSFNF